MEDKRQNLFEKHRENVYFRWGMTAFIVIAACLLLFELLSNLNGVFSCIQGILRHLSPVLYGLVIAYLLDPVVIRVQKLLTPILSRRIDEKRADRLSLGLGILAALVLLVFLIWALLSMMLPELLRSITSIIINLPGYYNTLSGLADRLMDGYPELSGYVDNAMNSIYNYLQNFLTPENLVKLQGMLVNLTSSVVAMAKAGLNLVIGLIISVYLLMGKRDLLARSKKLLYAFIPEKAAGHVCNVCTYANRVFGGFIGGKLVDSAIIGALCFLGMFAFHLDYALLISVIVGVTNVIPFFGPYLGAVPSALLLVVVSPVQALKFVIFILVLQQVDGNIIGPRILGDATGLSGLWVVVSILLFGGIWGVPGMIVGVPLFAVIYKIISEIVSRLLGRKGLSTETDRYGEWNYPPRPEADHWNKAQSGILFGRKKETRTEEKGPAEETEDPPDSPED